MQERHVEPAFQIKREDQRGKRAKKKKKKKKTAKKSHGFT
jgi:hypothetical protein